jgi:hypothetical protein
LSVVRGFNAADLGQGGPIESTVFRFWLLSFEFQVFSVQSTP